MKKLLLLFLMMSTYLVFGQIGSLDPNFFISNDGSSKGFNGAIFKVLRQSDGKLLCIGNFTKYGSANAPKIARLNADGTLDTSFASPNVGNNSIEALALQPDGKIMISGSFSSINSTARAFMGRLNSDGSLDTTFNANLQGSGYSVKTITVLSDGRIAAGGTFLLPGIINRRIAVFSSTGTVDSSFDANNTTVFDNQVTNIVEAPNNKLYAVGFFTGGLVRLNSDGTKDTTFDFGTGTGCGSGNMCITGIALTNNGNRIVVVGTFNSFSGDTTKAKIVKLLSNGSVDSTFNTAAVGFNGNISSVYANEDNSLYVSGPFTSYNATPVDRVAKLNANGNLDTSFENPKVGSSNVSGIVPFSNKLIIYGDFSTVNGFNTAKLAVLNDNGTRDFSFMLQGSGFDASINKVAKQADGKLVVIGGFNYLDNSQAMFITRMNADGTRDTTFNSGTGFNSAPQNIAIDKNGKIIVVGGFTEYNGLTVNKIVRLNTNGSLDSTFSPDVNGGSIDALDTDSNGKVYIGGLFNQVDGVYKAKLARLNTNGSLDTSFTGFNPGNTVGVGSNPTSFVKVIKVLASGDVLVGGLLPNYDNVVKLNSNGAKVANSAFFDVRVDGGYVGVIETYEDGRILIGGNFTAVSFNGKKRLARLSANGVLDNNFIIGGGFVNGEVKAISIQKDGTALIGGSFTKFNTASASAPTTYTDVHTYGLIKLTAVNAIVSTDYSTTFLNATANVLSLLSDNAYVYIGGSFSTYNSIAKNSLVRSFVSAPVPTAADQTLCPGSKVANLVADGENLKWYSALTGGAALASTHTLSTNTDYYVSQTIHNVESTRAKVRVTLQGTAAPTGNAVQYLSTGSTLANLSLTGSNIKWYATEDDALMKTNAIPSSTVVVFENTYYATQTIGTCESSMYLEIKVKDITLSVSDINKLKTSVYPNPAKEVITISNVNKASKIVIYTTDGRKVSEGTLTNNQYNVSKLSKGMYLIQIISDNEIETVKLIKE